MSELIEIVEPRVWRVIADPLAGNAEGTQHDKNEGGLLISLTDDDGVTSEVARVAYTRKHSTNKRTSFEDQLKKELGTAQVAADAMNDLEQRARDAVREARLAEEEAESAARQRREDLRIARSEAQDLITKARQLLDEAAAEPGAEPA